MYIEYGNPFQTLPHNRTSPFEELAKQEIRIAACSILVVENHFGSVVVMHYHHGPRPQLYRKCVAIFFAPLLYLPRGIRW